MNDIQKEILAIFKEVKEICDRNNVTYYAIGGTCIGAVRHKGFIPWDDDLDIAIPIQHFEKFFELAERELPNHFKVYRCENVKHYRYIFAKIHNANTTFIEEADVNYKDAQKGIWIDIMPISSIPEGRTEKKNFFKRMNYYYAMNFILRFPFSEMDSIKKKIMWILTRPMYVIVGYDYYSKKWLNMLKKYPLGSTGLTGYTWWNSMDNLIFPISMFATTTVLPFENTTIDCPVDYDGYLTKQFGNYMELPPIEERQDHHQVYVRVDEPYTNYGRK